MPSTIVIRDGDESSNGKSRSFVFHLLYTFAPTGHDLAADPPTLPTGTAPTGEWRAYLILEDDGRETITGWGLMQSDVEAVLRTWLRHKALIH